MGLGKSYGGGFGVGEYCRRHNLQIDVVGASRYVVHAAHSLHDCRMGEHAAAVNVANGVNAGHVGLHVVVNGYAAALRLYACGFNPDAFNVGRTPRGNEHCVGGCSPGLALAFVAYLQLAVGLADAGHSGLHHELDSALLHGLAHAARYVGVVWRQALFHVFDNGYFAAETFEHGCELESDYACADDAKPVGNGVGGEQRG